MLDPAASIDDKLQAAMDWATKWKALAPHSGLNTHYSADFLRLRELGLVWRAPPDIAGKLGFSNLVLALTARNLFKWDSYPGIDQEMNAYSRTNEANPDVDDNFLDSVDTATLTVLSEDLDLLADVLRFHILSGTVLSTDLVPGETLASIEGGVLAVTSGDEGQTLIDGAQLVTPDLGAVNGVVHIIDALLIPPQVATEIELNRIVELDPIQFGVGSATILQASQEILEQAAGILIANPVGDVEIQGHTDTDGSDEVNLELSQNRADAVLDFLVGAGVDPARLTSVGYGETQLKVSPEQSATDKATNRRIEFRVG